MINPDLKNVIKGWDRNSIASKIANDLPHASYVNLGIGMPELVSQHIKEAVSYTHLTLPTKA